MAIALVEAITVCSGSAGLIPSHRGWEGVERPLPLAKKTPQNLRVQCPQIHQGLPTHPHSNFQEPIQVNPIQELAILV